MLTREAMLHFTNQACNAQATSHSRPSSGRLRSLWDMYELDATHYHEGVVIIQQAIALMDGRNRIPQHEPMPPASVNVTDGMLRRFLQTIDPLPVPVSKLNVRDIRFVLNRVERAPTFGEYGQMLIGLSETLRRELETVKLFVLDANKVNFYEPQEPLFGAEVYRKFPSATYEIEQGGKCYACDLTTAAAFHWIRSLEAGIRAMARCLRIPDPTTGRERNWGQLNIAFRDKIETNWPRATGRMAGDAHLFDRLYGAISGMQNPYRNETMHLSAKYTAPEAIYVFEMVRGLMSQIASRMDEDGNPQV